MCKSASPVSRPSLIRDFSHVFTLLKVKKQSWGDELVIWERFMGPWNRKIGKTGYQKNFRDHFRGGVIAPTAPLPYGSAIAHHPTPLT